MKKIIYPDEDFGINVIHPTGLLSLDKTALKDVPSGVKYKIIDESDLPKYFRYAWEFDFSTDFDGVGE